MCHLEAPSGLIRVTSEAATLPAAAANTDLQPTIALQCSDSESDDGEATDALTVTDQGEQTGGGGGREHQGVGSRGERRAHT